MAPARPMLDEIELQQVQSIDVEADQVLIRHPVPALEGDFLQRLDRRASRISLHGILTGDEVRDGLEKLRAKFRAAAPVPFIADLTTATKVEQVLIEELGVRELAGKPARFEYAFTLREFLAPPAPAVEPPPPELPEEPDPETGTLVVEVIVEGQPNFDFKTVTVTIAGTQADGTALSRTLPTQEQNVWTEERFPPGQYTAGAVVTEPQAMSGSAAATVRAGQTTQVTITLRAGSIIAKAFIVHFRFDSAFVEPCMREVLVRASEYAQAHADEKLLIVGHTDKTGSEEYNQSLSERRARAVYGFMTFGRDSAAHTAALVDWNELRKPPLGSLPSLRDKWSTREYQYILQDLGYYIGNIDEQHGTKTDAAIRAFQQDNALIVNGQLDDATWEKLVETYMLQSSLAIPEDQFFKNAKDDCDHGPLKWLGCGELDPVKNTLDAWRPNRRTEILFVRADAIPCEVPQPVTFDLPGPGAVNSGWCLGPGSPNQRCCFTTRGEAQEGKWLIHPAEPGSLLVSGTITFEDGTPVANAKYALIAPDGEFLHTNSQNNADLGERPQGPERGRPIPNRADANGRFSYPRETPVGIYVLEIFELQDPQVAREDDEPREEARGNVICFRLDAAATGTTSRVEGRTSNGA